MFLKDFQEGEVGKCIKSPKRVQSPEMIRQSRRIPGLFHITEASSILFCPEQTGQSKQKTRHIFAACPGMFTKTQRAEALVSEITAMSKCQLIKWCFAFPVYLLSVPVGVLTPNPSPHTQAGMQDSALKAMASPSTQNRLPAHKEGRQLLRWRIIWF